MRVAAREFVFAVNAEGVIPDHPAPAAEAQLALENQFQFSGEFIADGQPECAGGLERPHQSLAPLARPVEIFVGFELVFVDIVFVSDVERRVGEGQIDAAGRDLGHSCDAVTVVQLVEFQFQCAHL